MTGSVATLVDDVEALSDLEEEWRALAELRSNAFVTPEWFYAFIANAGAAIRPAVVVARRSDGSLLGVLPLVTAASSSGRQVRFAGASLGDYFHPAAALEDEDEVARLAAAALSQQRDPLNLLILHNVDRTATWPETLRGGLRKHAELHDRDDVLPFAGLGASWDDFLSARSRNLRSQLGRKLRALEGEHAVRFRRTTSKDELPVDMATFLYLHHRRWQTRADTSSLGATSVRAFHHDFAAAALERGWLRLWFLEVEGTPVAAWYGWRLGERYAYYSAGFDPEWADRSVGLLLFAHTIRSAIEEGASEYDMLLGNESYKSRFETDRKNVRTVLVPRIFHPAWTAVAAEIALRRAGNRLPESVREHARRAAKGVITRLPTSRVL